MMLRKCQQWFVRLFVVVACLMFCGDSERLFVVSQLTTSSGLVPATTSIDIETHTRYVTVSLSCETLVAPTGTPPMVRIVDLVRDAPQLNSDTTFPRGPVELSWTDCVFRGVHNINVDLTRPDHSNWTSPVRLRLSNMTLLEEVAVQLVASGAVGAYNFDIVISDWTVDIDFHSFPGYLLAITSNAVANVTMSVQRCNVTVRSWYAVYVMSVHGTADGIQRATLLIHDTDIRVITTQEASVATAVMDATVMLAVVDDWRVDVTYCNLDISAQAESRVASIILRQLSSLANAVLAVRRCHISLHATQVVLNCPNANAAFCLSLVSNSHGSWQNVVRVDGAELHGADSQITAVSKWAAATISVVSRGHMTAPLALRDVNISVQNVSSTSAAGVGSVAVVASVISFDHGGDLNASAISISVNASNFTAWAKDHVAAVMSFWSLTDSGHVTLSGVTVALFTSVVSAIANTGSIVLVAAIGASSAPAIVASDVQLSIYDSRVYATAELQVIAVASVAMFHTPHVSLENVVLSCREATIRVVGTSQGSILGVSAFGYSKVNASDVVIVSQGDSSLSCQANHNCLVGGFAMEKCAPGATVRRVTVSIVDGSVVTCATVGPYSSVAAIAGMDGTGRLVVSDTVLLIRDADVAVTSTGNYHQVACIVVHLWNRGLDVNATLILVERSHVTVLAAGSFTAALSVTCNDQSWESPCRATDVCLIAVDSVMIVEATGGRGHFTSVLVIAEYGYGHSLVVQRAGLQAWRSTINVSSAEATIVSALSISAVQGVLAMSVMNVSLAAWQSNVSAVSNYLSQILCITLHNQGMPLFVQGAMISGVGKGQLLARAGELAVIATVSASYRSTTVECRDIAISLQNCSVTARTVTGWYAIAVAVLIFQDVLSLTATNLSLDVGHSTVDAVSATHAALVVVVGNIGRCGVMVLENLSMIVRDDSELTAVNGLLTPANYVVAVAVLSAVHSHGAILRGDLRMQIDESVVRCETQLSFAVALSVVSREVGGDITLGPNIAAVIIASHPRSNLSVRAKTAAMVLSLAGAAGDRRTMITMLAPPNTSSSFPFGVDGVVPNRNITFVAADIIATSSATLDLSVTLSAWADETIGSVITLPPWALTFVVCGAAVSEVEPDTAGVGTKFGPMHVPTNLDVQAFVTPKCPSSSDVFPRLPVLSQAIFFATTFASASPNFHGFGCAATLRHSDQLAAARRTPSTTASRSDATAQMRSSTLTRHAPPNDIETPNATDPSDRSFTLRRHAPVTATRVRRRRYSSTLLDHAPHPAQRMSRSHSATQTPFAGSTASDDPLLLRSAVGASPTVASARNVATAAAATAGVAGALFGSPLAGAQAVRSVATMGVALCASIDDDFEPSHIDMPIQWRVGAGPFSSLRGGLIATVALWLWLPAVGLLGIAVCQPLGLAQPHRVGLARAGGIFFAVLTPYFIPVAVGGAAQLLSAPHGAATGTTTIDFVIAATALLTAAVLLAGMLRTVWHFVPLKLVGVPRAPVQGRTTVWAFPTAWPRPLYFQTSANDVRVKKVLDDGASARSDEPAEASSSLFLHAVAPMIDAAKGVSKSDAARFYFVEEVFCAVLATGLGSVRPGVQAYCMRLGVVMSITALMHISFVLYVRPYARRLDALFATLNALGGLILSVAATLCNNVPSGTATKQAASSPPWLKIYAILSMTLQSVFFAQAAANALHYGYRRWAVKRDRRLAATSDDFKVESTAEGAIPTASSVPLLAAPSSSESDIVPMLTVMMHANPLLDRREL